MAPGSDVVRPRPLTKHHPCHAHPHHSLISLHQTKTSALVARAACGCAMLACNGVMLSAFVRSMHLYGSLLATVANNGANFIATVRQRPRLRGRMNELRGRTYDCANVRRRSEWPSRVLNQPFPRIASYHVVCNCLSTPSRVLNQPFPILHPIT